MASFLGRWGRLRYFQPLRPPFRVFSIKKAGRGFLPRPATRTAAFFIEKPKGKGAVKFFTAPLPLSLTSIAHSFGFVKQK